ncbi:MAG: GNAT family N-acetyltransferase [Victivallales bacterium]
MKQIADIRIQPLVPDDVEVAARVVMETFRTHVAPHYSQQGIEEFAKYAEPDSLQGRHGHGHQTWTAKIGDAIVGVLEIRFPNHIAMLFVSTNHQGIGIGRRLVEHAKAQVLNVSPDAETLTVHSSPNAIPAYRKLGFRECGGMQEKNGIKFQQMTMELKAYPIL